MGRRGAADEFEALGAQDAEQLESLVVVGAGGGGEHEEDLLLVGVEQDLAVQVELADQGVHGVDPLRWTP